MRCALLGLELKHTGLRSAGTGLGSRTFYQKCNPLKIFVKQYCLATNYPITNRISHRGMGSDHLKLTPVDSVLCLAVR